VARILCGPLNYIGPEIDCVPPNASSADFVISHCRLRDVGMPCDGQNDLHCLDDVDV
jgi:hypothetical protein